MQRFGRMRQWLRREAGSERVQCGRNGLFQPGFVQRGRLPTQRQGQRRRLRGMQTMQWLRRMWKWLRGEAGSIGLQRGRDSVLQAGLVQSRRVPTQRQGHRRGLRPMQEVQRLWHMRQCLRKPAGSVRLQWRRDGLLARGQVPRRRLPTQPPGQGRELRSMQTMQRLGDVRQRLRRNNGSARLRRQHPGVREWNLQDVQRTLLSRGAQLLEERDTQVQR